MNEDKKPIEVKTTKKHSYGKYFLLLLLLTGIYQMSTKNIAPHSLSAPVAFFVTFLEVVLDVGVFYLLVLWIMDMIRRRGGVEREENKKVKLIVNIIFAIIIIGIVGSIALTLINTSPNKLNAEQSAFLDEFYQEQQKLVVLNNKQKAISVELANIEDSQQMKKILSDLLSVTQKIQDQIDEFKFLLDKNTNIFESEKEKSALTTFGQSIDLRERHNKKLIELATLGLEINWDNPSESQINKWTEIAEELVVIETEIQNKQLDFLKAFQELSQ